MSQIRRTAMPVPMNIAEGHGRKTTSEYIRYMLVYGSNRKLETQILLSGDLGCIKAEKLKEIQEDISEVERILKALITFLENKHLNSGILESFVTDFMGEEPIFVITYILDSSFGVMTGVIRVISDGKG